MELLYKNREQSEKDFITLVCNDILSKPIEEKEYSEDFAFIFVDGRKDTNFETLEHWAAFHSCRAFSKKRYPIFCFINNIEGLNKSKLVAKYNLITIKIQEINSLGEYSKFWRYELYNLIPNNIIHGITIQADGFLLKPNFEKFILDNNFIYCGAHFKHLPSIDYFNNIWISELPRVFGYNGGFSYRRMDKCKQIINNYKDYKFRERYTEDKEPQEDLLLSVLCKKNNEKLPTLIESDLWSKDPLTKKDWDNGSYGYGYHFIKLVSEFPECAHN